MHWLRADIARTQVGDHCRSAGSAVGPPEFLAAEWACCGDQQISVGKQGGVGIVIEVGIETVKGGEEVGSGRRAVGPPQARLRPGAGVAEVEKARTRMNGGHGRERDSRGRDAVGPLGRAVAPPQGDDAIRAAGGEEQLSGRCGQECGERGLPAGLEVEHQGRAERRAVGDPELEAVDGVVGGEEEAIPHRGQRPANPGAAAAGTRTEIAHHVGPERSAVAPPELTAVRAIVLEEEHQPVRLDDRVGRVPVVPMKRDRSAEIRHLVGRLGVRTRGCEAEGEHQTQAEAARRSRYVHGITSDQRSVVSLSKPSRKRGIVPSSEIAQSS